MKFLFPFLILSFTWSFTSTTLHAEAKSSQEERVYYQCSMHPWITSDKPGNCPVCGMMLTKASSSENSQTSIHGHAKIHINAERQQLIGITKEKVTSQQLTYSVHSVGHVAYNPDVYTALADYREAYTVYRKTRGTATRRVTEDADKLMQIAELKLRLSGFGSEQLDQIKKASFNTRILSDLFAPEGLFLPEGHVWIDTDLYESDSEMVKPGDKVSMSSPALPGKIFAGTVRVSEPVLNAFPRKIRVRIESPYGNELKAGMAVDVRIMVDLGNKLAVSETALVDSGHSQLVFVDKGDGDIEPRKVEIGQQSDNYYEIVSGLHEGETVITSANFLIDSESRLKAAAQSFSSHRTEGHSHG